MLKTDCKVAQKGFSAGPVFFCRKAAVYPDPAEDAGLEEERLSRAVEALHNRLSGRLQKADQAEAELFEAEIMILHDAGYTGRARTLVKEENMNAAEALHLAEKQLCEKLLSGGDPYIKERCEDIRGMTAQLISLLSERGTDLPREKCILAGEELSPSDLSLIDPDLILGILTEKGSPTTHVSVLAGNMDVPYLYGVENLEDRLCDGDYVILDAYSGTVIIDPPEEERKAAEERRNRLRREKKQWMEQAAGCFTKTKVYANLSGMHELETLQKTKADGIGLVRSEFLFLNREDPPSEEDQFEVYRRIVSAMDGKEVVIRTLDIDSDKQAGWLSIPPETNPALGQRGLRVSLLNRELFGSQLRALLRTAASGNLRIMVPMVTAEWEIDAVAEEIKAAALELEKRGESYRIPELGVMIETPASVMIAQELASRVRFFSIGTNDLTRYTLALDREVSGLESFYDPLHEAVFRMIALAVKAAHDHGIPAAVCGELGGNPAAVEKLIRLGVDELSVSVGKICQVKKLVSEIEKRNPERFSETNPEEQK